MLIYNKTREVFVFVKQFRPGQLVFWNYSPEQVCTCRSLAVQIHCGSFVRCGPFVQTSEAI